MVRAPQIDFHNSAVLGMGQQLGVHAGAKQVFCKTFAAGWASQQIKPCGVYVRLTSHLSPAEVLYFNQILSEETVDEAAFNAKRMLWALGHHPPHICAAASGTVA